MHAYSVGRVKWTVHGEESIYESEWVRLRLVDVEIPALPGHPSRRFGHHVVRSNGPAAGAVVINDADEVLLLWRHRFISDNWGWEIPAGGVDPGETSLDAAGREVLEETGWQPGALEPLTQYFPSNGSSDQRFDLFRGHGATHVGEPSDPSESERIEWVPVARLREEIAAGNMRDGLSLTAILWCFAFEQL